MSNATDVTDVTGIKAPVTPEGGTAAPLGQAPVAAPFRLGVDLDGVLTEHPRPLAYAANEQFGMDLPERAFIDSAGLNVPESVRDWVYSPAGPAAHLATAEGAVAFIRDVQQALGATNVMIITARPASSAQMTLDWLAGHGFPPIEVFFADDKVTVARQQGCIAAVEDSARHARNYAAAGMGCYLLQTGDAGQPIGPMAELTEESATRIIDATDLAQIAGLVREAAEARTSMALRGEAAAGATIPAIDRPRVVVSDQIHPLARARLEASADILDVDGTDVRALLDAVTDADALVVRSETQVTAEVFAAAPKLRVVARAGVGVDNIDIPAATAAGVLVLNAPGANAVSAGEHTVGLLLALTRQITSANATLHTGTWDRKRYKPVDLAGRTVGIVGLGHVGSVVASRLLAFGMRVIAHDPKIAPSRFEEMGVRPVGLDELYATSDIISFHVPVTPQTARMLNAETIQRLKPGVIVLNVARGEIVDQEALAAALTSGHVAAAAVDVFPVEPTTHSPLFGLDNVVVTPHIGGSSVEALAAIGEVISTTTLAALRGEAVPNAVNLPAASLEGPALRRLSEVAAAAGRLLTVLAPDGATAFRLTVHGNVPVDIAEHTLGVALAEALQSWSKQRVTPVNARLVAGEMGIAVGAVQGDNRPNRLPEFTLTAASDPPHHVTIRWDRSSAEIVEVDRFPFERGLNGYVLITHHTDQPGMIGQVGTILGRHGINIAGMQLGRHSPRTEAITVINVDDPIGPEAMAELGAIPGIGNYYVVSLPAAALSPAQAAFPGSDGWGGF
ncbi:MAG TPA: phosphoglycerate dehydrogenase [Thermomicrobiales bacterium]|nr:phosphoglycerate dehydrogenase [Thermomicrobiales bacterium]